MTREQDFRCQQMLLRYEELIRGAKRIKDVDLEKEYRQEALNFLNRYSAIFNEEMLYKK